MSTSQIAVIVKNKKTVNIRKWTFYGRLLFSFSSGFFWEKFLPTSFFQKLGKRAFDQGSLVLSVIWAGTKGLATSPLIRPRVRHPLVPVRYKPLVSV
jgi:hypothetical protein